MSDPAESSSPPDQHNDPFRKLIRSMILVVILLACGAVLLALGQCAGRRREVQMRKPSYATSQGIGDTAQSAGTTAGAQL